MFKRRFTLEIERLDQGVYQWKLISRYGRVVAMGAAPRMYDAHKMAAKKLPAYSRIKGVRILT
jgi:hypothetical protein